MPNPPDSDEREIAARLKLWRTKRLIPQATFARAINLQPTTLWTYEIGRVPVKAKVALDAWKNLNLNPGWLRGTGGPETLNFATFGSLAALFKPPRPREDFSFYYDTTLAAALGAPVGEFLSLKPAFWNVIQRVEVALDQAGVTDGRHAAIIEILYGFLNALDEFGTLIDAEIRGISKTKRKFNVDVKEGAEDGAVMPSAHPPLFKSWSELRTEICEMTTVRGARSALAAKLGVSRQVVGGWLSAASAPDAHTTIQLLNWTRGIEPQPKETASALNTPKRQKVQKPMKQTNAKHEKPDRRKK